MTYLYPYKIDTHIYDIFYNNDSIVVIAPFEKEYTISLIDDKHNYNFEIIKDRQKHTLIYKLITKYQETIILSINNELHHIQLKKYADLTNKILMSTIVKDEDNYIIQWITYHSLLGIDVFVIYDNSEKNTLEDILQEYILSGKVILIKWIYPYILPKSGISGQTTQQNHSLYAFRTAKYIGFFDIDEYLNPQEKEINIDNFLTQYIQTNKLNLSDLGSFRLLNKLFHNPDNKPTDNYNFLNIYNCEKITQKGREKNFVIPKNVYVFSVHMIVSGKKMHTVNPTHIYFNHYFFLNKQTRGRDKTGLIDDTIKNKLKLIQ